MLTGYIMPTPVSQMAGLCLSTLKTHQPGILFCARYQRCGHYSGASQTDGTVPLTYIGSAHEGLKEFKLPGSVSTEGYNINQDGSIVGNYESADGRTHGFIARPAGDDQPVDQPTLLTYTFESIDVPGVDF